MDAPNWLPSPSASSIIWPRWAWLMTISVMPARTRLRICQVIRGRPRTLSRGLGQASVSGRMRSPRPAAKIIAFMGTPSEGVADLRRFFLERVEQADQGFQHRVAVGRLAHVIEHGGQVAHVDVLAVAVIEAAEDAQDFQVALQGHEFESAVKCVDVRVDGQAHLLGALPI